jgi:hypothetical protein
MSQALRARALMSGTSLSLNRGQAIGVGANRATARQGGSGPGTPGGRGSRAQKTAREALRVVDRTTHAREDHPQ